MVLWGPFAGGLWGVVDKGGPGIGGQGGRLVRFDVDWIQKTLNSATER